MGSTPAESANRLGPFKCVALHLQKATFKARVSIDVDPQHYSNLSGSTLEQGGSLHFRKGTVDLSQMSLGDPLRISGQVDAEVAPEIVSISNADAGQMSFARVDMRRCLFYGAHGVDAINLESSVLLPKAPWRAVRRTCIADEFAWRATAVWWRRWGWKLDGVHVGNEPPMVRRGEATPAHFPLMERAPQVAGTYRELRRTLESKSDMSRAAVFDYGEMEMRRFSKGIDRRSGFSSVCIGPRAGTDFDPRGRWFGGSQWSVQAPTRCRLAALPLIRGHCHAGILFALRASLPGVSTLEKLTPFGQGVEIALRVAGPLMIALFVLAVRARVMRKPGD